MSIFSHFIDIFWQCVDGADMYRKQDFLITSLAICSKIGGFLSLPNHIEDILGMVCTHHFFFSSFFFALSICFTLCSGIGKFSGMVPPSSLMVWRTF